MVEWNSFSGVIFGVGHFDRIWSLCDNLFWHLLVFTSQGTICCIVDFNNSANLAGWMADELDSRSGNQFVVANVESN